MREKVFRCMHTALVSHKDVETGVLALRVIVDFLSRANVIRIDEEKYPQYKLMFGKLHKYPWKGEYPTGCINAFLSAVTFLKYRPSEVFTAVKEELCDVLFFGNKESRIAAGTAIISLAYDMDAFYGHKEQLADMWIQFLHGNIGDRFSMTRNKLREELEIFDR